MADGLRLRRFNNAAAETLSIADQPRIGHFSIATVTSRHQEIRMNWPMWPDLVDSLRLDTADLGPGVRDLRGDDHQISSPGGA
jgi:hypothetical protein